MFYFRLRAILLASTCLILYPAFGLTQQSPRPRQTATVKKVEISKNQAFRKEQMNMRICKAFPAAEILKPRVTINGIKQAGSMKGGKYHISGIVDGACLKEAGLYQNGERVFKFPLKTTPTYTSFEFELDVLMDDDPEIRVFDINWQRSSKFIFGNKNKTKNTIRP